MADALAEVFISSWSSLFRTAVVGTIAYVSLGSTLATVLLSRDVSLADGVWAFAVFIGLQVVVTWTSVRVQ